MDWDLPQLQALAAVVDHGSLESASRALQVTPSAISQRLKGLERSTGAVLVHRGRPCRPTEAGMPVVRLARQIAAAGDQAEHALRPTATLPEVRLAVNADSLATWVLAALAPLAGEVQLRFLREDQDHTVDLLRDGRAMAAITSDPVPVQGCRSEPLGGMRYLPTATRAFVERWFPNGMDSSTLAGAPVVVFDPRDRLQDLQLQAGGIDPAAPPRHLVPASTQYAEAVGQGYGWGMIPEGQLLDQCVDLGLLPGSPLTDHLVNLHWQQWALPLLSLDRVADAIRRAAATALVR